MQFINHYSIVITFVFVFMLTAFFTLRGGAQPRDFYLLAALAAALFAAWTFLRPTAKDAETTSEFQASLGQGQPVLLELQSPF